MTNSKQYDKKDIDPLFQQALAECIIARQATATMLRRRFDIGYPRAARLLDQMENGGFISSANDLHGREVYISKEDYEKLFECEPKSILSQDETKRVTISDDEIVKKCLRLIAEGDFSPTATGIRRKFNVGYPRAAKIIDKLEELGYISGHEKDTIRQILITKEECLKLLNEK